MVNFAVAVVGTGFIGPVHVEGLRRAGVPVRGMLGSSRERSERTAHELGVEVAYASFEQILGDERIGAVHIATPNRFHFDMASRALRAGKHVLCEKPLAMTSDESAELVRLAADSGLAAAVAYNVRFYPLCHEAAERRRRGELGDLYHVSGSYVQDWLLHETDFNWRVLADAGGELRAVADIGTHWLDLAQFISGHRVTAVCADLRTIHGTRRKPRGATDTFSSKLAGGNETEPVKINTEDCGGMLLRFDNDARGTLWVSQVAAGRKNCLRWEIAGSRQAMAWDSEQPNALWIGHRERANESLIRDPALLGASARAISSYPGGHNEGFPDTFKQLFRAFYGHVAAGQPAGKPPYPTFADGHQEILLCEAILRSHRQRRWEEVG
jgi:predicted dehydrogenase